MKKKFNKKKLNSVLHNKKVMIPAVLILSLALVAAVIYYTATINVTANITEPFVTSEIPLSFSGVATDSLDEVIGITNNAQATLPATITWIPREGLDTYTMSITQFDGTDLEPSLDLEESHQIIDIPNGEHSITVTFSTPSANTGVLTLSKKNVVFGSAPWALVDGEGTKVQVEYTLVGDEFSAEVIGEEVLDYVLIYYADNPDRFTYPEKAILVSDVVGDLPYVDDANADEYDYCVIEGYNTCHGAKIWYVPEGAIDDEGNIDWGQASDFYFETDLITYTQTSDSNNIGVITVERIA